MIVIELWETNAGGLLLHREGEEFAVSDVEFAVSDTSSSDKDVPSSFGEDAAQMAAAQPRWIVQGHGGFSIEVEPTHPGAKVDIWLPDHWTMPVVLAAELDSPGTRLVASWEDGKISLQADAVAGGAPGRAARKYLGLSNDDEQTGSPEWAPTHRHHWGPNPDQFDELMLCDEGRDDGSVGAYTREEWEASIRGHWPEIRRCADGSWVKAGSYGEDQDCTPRITTLTDERVDGLDLPLGWS